MTDPEVPKVLATQIDGKIRLVWEKPEDEAFWLEFEPLIHTVVSRMAIVNTQVATIPQNCILYMDATIPGVSYLVYSWVKNNHAITAYDNNAWKNRSIELDAGDQLYIEIKQMSPRPSSFSGNVALHIGDIFGSRVAEFDYTYP